jgi:hypothetical protein
VSAAIPGVIAVTLPGVTGRFTVLAPTPLGGGDPIGTLRGGSSAQSSSGGGGSAQNVLSGGSSRQSTGSGGDS